MEKITFKTKEIKTEKTILPKKSKPKFYTGYDAPPAEGLAFKKESRTKSEFVNECDINTIVKRAIAMGTLPEATRKPVYADVSEIPDYENAMNAVAKANQAFMSLPSHIRDEFDQSPQALMEFLADSKNRKRAEELGLINPASPSVPPVVATAGEQTETEVKK